MKTFQALFLGCFSVLFSALGFGQGVFVPPQTALKTVNGTTSPIAGASITVCAANAGGIPCSPALTGTIFKDAALTQPLSNPFAADASGNYTFAIAPGTYTVTVTAAGFSGNSYQISPGAVTLQTNGTNNGSQAKLNLIAGSNVTIADGGTGGVTVSSSGSSPSGSNVMSLPPLTVATGNQAGRTLVLIIPAQRIMAFGSAIKVGLTWHGLSGSTPIITAASIGATLPNPAPSVAGFTYNYAWTTSPVSLTWPGSFTVDNKIYFSNPATIAIDNNHDYYIAVALSNSSTGSSLYFQSTGTEYSTLGGSIAGNHAADADASNLALAPSEILIPQVIIP